MSDDHYYSQDPSSPSARREIRATLRGESWRFITDRGVFSHDKVDFGSKLLIETMTLDPGAIILDVGGGYGPIGLAAARLIGPEGQAHLVEVNARAAELARENAALNGLGNVTVHLTDDLATLDLPPLDAVLTNPPVRTGWKVVMPLLDAAAAKLKVGGSFWLVGYKHLGVKTLGKHLATLLGEPETVDKKGGYRVLRATREDPDV